MEMSIPPRPPTICGVDAKATSTNGAIVASMVTQRAAEKKDPCTTALATSSTSTRSRANIQG